MSDHGPELDRLREELRVLNAKLWEDIVYTGSVWNWDIGDVGIRRVVRPGMTITIYSLFNTICFIAGVVFSLLGGNLASLGIALIVGSIFSASAFLTQFWAVSYQRQKEVFEAVLGDNLDDLKNAAARRQALIRRIATLTSQTGQPPHGPRED